MEKPPQNPSARKSKCDASLSTPESMTALNEAALRIQETSTATVLAKCSSEPVDNPRKAAAFAIYRNKVIVQAGNPADPLERMLVEQIILAQQKIGDLHVRAAQAADAQAVGCYVTAAARLMAECRKSMLALKAYRTPSSPPQMTFVQQQNLASGDQQIALINNAGGAQLAAKKNRDTELTSKPVENLIHDPLPELNAQSAPGRGRTPESIETQRADSRRPRKAAAVGHQTPPMGQLNGSAHVGW
jgi:hypothetical protein